MVKADKEDRNLVVAVLSDSFKNNLSVNFIVQQDEQKDKRIRALMEYSFDMCSLFGNVFLSDDKNSCALILYPHLKKTTLLAIWLDIKLIFKAVGIGGISKALKREAQIKHIQPKEEMLYLWFIGVDPFLQHKGIGSKLMDEVIQLSKTKNLPLLLETSTIENLPWYKRFGFETYDKLELGYTLYFLKRNWDTK